MAPLNSVTHCPAHGINFQDIQHQDTYKVSTNLITDVSKRKDSTCVFSIKDQPHILSVPVQIPCGHRVCKACLGERFLNHEAFCCPKNEVNPSPDCARKITREYCFEDNFSKREINELAVLCEHYPESDDQQGGCRWNGRFSDYKDHHLGHCRIGKADYLTEENKYLKKQVESYGTASSNNELDAYKAENQQIHKTVSELNKTISLKDREITELQTTIKKMESDSNEMIKQYLAKIGDCQSELAAYKLQYDEMAASLPNNQGMANAPTKPETAARPKSSGLPSGQVASTSQSVKNSNELPQGNSADWSFDYVTTPKNADNRIESRVFSVGHYNYKLIFQYRWSTASVYLQVVGGDKDAVWPCQESLTISLKKQSGKGQDISKTLHLANAPAPCRNQPGNSRHTENTMVGFANFCQDRHLSLPKGGMDTQPLYLNRKNEITLSVTRATKPSEGVIPSVYDVPSGSVDLHWPVREYSRKDSAYSPSDSYALSPQFYTSDGGYCLKLKLDTQNASGTNGTYTGIEAVLQMGKNDHVLPWPLKGKLAITLVDQDPQSTSKNNITMYLPIVFEGPTKKDHYQGYGSNTSREMPFYTRMSVIDEECANHQKPLYKHNDTVLITATFIPLA